VGHRAGVTPTNTHPESDLSWPASTHAARRFIMAALPNASAMDLTASESDPRGRSDEPPILKLPSRSKEPPSARSVLRPSGERDWTPGLERSSTAPRTCASSIIAPEFQSSGRLSPRPCG
jgi:hypothetical protein